MAKPVNPRCDLRCRYCYYPGRDRLYPDTKRFISRHLENEEVRKLLAAAFREVLGEPLKMDAVFRGEEPSLFEEPDPSPAPERAEGDPEVKKVIDLFNGRVVGREEG